MLISIITVAYLSSALKPTKPTKSVARRSVHRHKRSALSKVRARNRNDKRLSRFGKRRKHSGRNAGANKTRGDWKSNVGSSNANARRGRRLRKRLLLLLLRPPPLVLMMLAMMLFLVLGLGARGSPRSRDIRKLWNPNPDPADATKKQRRPSLSAGNSSSPREQKTR
jgi:hypothetical protein